MHNSPIIVILLLLFVPFFLFVCVPSPPPFLLTPAADRGGGSYYFSSSIPREIYIYIYKYIPPLLYAVRGCIFVRGGARVEAGLFCVNVSKTFVMLVARQKIATWATDGGAQNFF